MKAYDPLDYENLARSVVTALLESVSTLLPPVEKFSGSGVYTLYYTGSSALLFAYLFVGLDGTYLCWQSRSDRREKR